MKSIDVIISPQGETRITTHGFSGTACQAASKSLQMAFGTTSQETLLPEYFSAPNVVSHHQAEDPPF